MSELKSCGSPGGSRWFWFSLLRRLGVRELAMRNVITVTKTNVLVGVLARVSVIVKRNVAMLPSFLRHLHQALRPYGQAGTSSFPMFGTMQPARATAITAAAAASRRERWDCPASRPSTRHG